MQQVYLDHGATTPVRPEVRETVLEYLTGNWGNQSSMHSVGRKARQGLDEARESAARLINARRKK